MTRAEWNASIEAQGTLTVGMVPAHIQQALQDGDGALVGLTLNGTPLTAGQISSRDNLKAGLEIYAAASFQNSAAIVSLAARTQIITQGDGYYAVTGAP